jgi:hypothetical protein
MAQFNTIMANFVITKDVNDVITTADLKVKFKELNGGSTKGVMAFLKHVATLANKLDKPSRYTGIKSINNDNNAPILSNDHANIAPILSNDHANIAPVVSNNRNDTGMTAYELACLELKREKIHNNKEGEEIKLKLKEMDIQAQKESEERQAKAKKESEERQAKAKKESEERQIQANKELKEMDIQAQRELKDKDIAIEEKKIRVKCEYMDKSFAFQREENNKDRILSHGFVNDGDYFIMGTPSNPMLETDRVINNINYFYPKEEHRVPLIEFAKDNSKVIVLRDSTSRLGLALNIMIDLHHNVIFNKNNDQVEYDQIKKDNLIDDNYDANMVKTLLAIIELMKTESDDDKSSFYDLTESNYKRLTDLKNELLVHGYTYTQELDQYVGCQKLKQQKVVKKTMMKKERYITEENELITHDDVDYINCYVCKELTLLAKAHRSHIVARHNGGTCNEDNVKLCCRTCNLSMGTMNLNSYKKTIETCQMDISTLYHS